MQYAELCWVQMIHAFSQGGLTEFCHMMRALREHLFVLMMSGGLLMDTEKSRMME